MGAAKVRRQLLGDEKYYQGQLKVSIATEVYQCPDFFQEYLNEQGDGLDGIQSVIPTLVNDSDFALTLVRKGHCILMGGNSNIVDKYKDTVLNRVIKKVHQSPRQFTLIRDEMGEDKQERRAIQEALFTAFLELMDNPEAIEKLKAINKFIPV